jgi:hypothetical protein
VALSCEQRDERLTAVRLLVLALEYATRTDALADAVTARYLRLAPRVAEQCKKGKVHLNLLLVEALSRLLWQALSAEWPAEQPLSPDLRAALPPVMALLARLSTMVFSRVMLDCSVAIARALRQTEAGEELRRLSLRSLAGVISDNNLSPDLLVTYTNTPEARAHCYAAAGHMCDALERDPVWGPGSVLEEGEAKALLAALMELSRVGEADHANFGRVTFFCVLAMTFIVTKVDCCGRRLACGLCRLCWVADWVPFACVTPATCRTRTWARRRSCSGCSRRTTRWASPGCAGWRRAASSRCSSRPPPRRRAATRPPRSCRSAASSMIIKHDQWSVCLSVTVAEP